MEVTAKLSNFRAAPRKVRLVADLVRGKKASEAQAILLFTVNKSARSVLKLLNSAMDSATKNYKLDESTLVVSKITVDEGPKMKRWHPMSRGRAYPIIKRTSHIALVLSDMAPAVKVEKEVKKEEKTEKPAVKKTTAKKIAKPRNTTKKAIVTGKQIGRASCRERVYVLV